MHGGAVPRRRGEPWRGRHKLGRPDFGCKRRRPRPLHCASPASQTSPLGLITAKLRSSVSLALRRALLTQEAQMVSTSRIHLRGSLKECKIEAMMCAFALQVSCTTKHVLRALKHSYTSFLSR